MLTTSYYSYISSPLGRMIIKGDGRFVTGLHFPHQTGRSGADASWIESDSPFVAVRRQLAEYFAGERRQFDVPVKLVGTPFQKRVWQELLKIPLGEIITFSQLAERVGKSTASRAVGNANGRNPISIIVPCHRVIGADGTLTGYAGGVDRKKRLLALEKAAVLAPIHK